MVIIIDKVDHFSASIIITVRLNHLLSHDRER